MNETVYTIEQAEKDFQYWCKLGNVNPKGKSKYKVPKSEFPPCMLNILNGIKDGKKRALFILKNYLLCSNYSLSEVREIIIDWNNENEHPLNISYINYHLKYGNNREFACPNCSKSGYYKSLNVCVKDDICDLIKSPLQYSYHKHKRLF